MTKKKTKHSNVQSLFAPHSQNYDRRIRRQRALFIPRLVSEAADKQYLKDEAADNAFSIVQRWAAREKDGTLYTDNETTIDTQFLDQLFGEGLGYRIKTKSPEAWELEHKLSVKGVGIADGALGVFPTSKTPAVVIELKNANTDLDRDRSNGRSAVQQCWDYLNALPDCPWGIVSNFRTIRLYHRSKGFLSFEEYSLQELCRRDRFDEFYCLFERDGLLPSKLKQLPRAEQLLKKTTERQKTVGDDLYRDYQRQRLTLIEHLNAKEGKEFNEAIRIAQKLLDRIIFIAFCEDRELLPENTLKETIEDIPRYSRAQNPAWESFLKLFSAIDKGVETNKVQITAFNGGLFADDPAINSLELPEPKWTNDFAGFGAYDFSEEVNVDVLGHLFERSITELEKLRIGGLFALKANVEAANGTATVHGKGKKKAASDDESPLSKMPKSAQRKRFGIYYTPPAFTGLIVERTVDALIKERFSSLAQSHDVDPDARKKQDQGKLLAYWKSCLEELKSLTVCDPACGSGAFLIRAYESLDLFYKVVVNGLAAAGMPPEQYRTIEDEIPDLILTRNLFGVDLSREGVEITQLALWIRSARVGKTLADLSKNIVHGNSLVSDKSVDPHAVDWEATFPEVFAKGGFSCVIGNPPWEKVKVQDREFFSLTDPTIAQTVKGSERKRKIDQIQTTNPDLYNAYLSARNRAKVFLDYARKSEKYPLTGQGDINTYPLFAELARNIVCQYGIVGIIVPTGIATDDSNKDFFGQLVSDNVLICLYDFENKTGIFGDVHRSYKFSTLVFGGSKNKSLECDFLFFAQSVNDINYSHAIRHIRLSSSDIILFNPNTKTCPIFRTQLDAKIAKYIYSKVPILIDYNREQDGNTWKVKFFTIFHQTNDSSMFLQKENLEKQSFKLTGNCFVKKEQRFLPLYEAKMFRPYDHRFGSAFTKEENYQNQGHTTEATTVNHINPEFLVMPRWWADESVIRKRLPSTNTPALLAFRNITRSTDTRTFLATFLPIVGVINSAPLIHTEFWEFPRKVCCLLSNINSYVLDFIVRNKIGNVNLNFFIIEQLPILPPDTYIENCHWSNKESLEQWISERVLKLSCTAEDMIPLAQACGFKGSRGDGVHIWKESERAILRAELDAAYFHLYGIARNDVEYILSTFTNTGIKLNEDNETRQLLLENDSVGQMILRFYDQYANSI